MEITRFDSRLTCLISPLFCLQSLQQVVPLSLMLLLSFSSDTSLREAASSAYAQTCAPYHSWAIRAAVSAGMYTLPSRDQLLENLHETGEFGFCFCHLSLKRYYNKIFVLPKCCWASTALQLWSLWISGYCQHWCCHSTPLIFSNDILTSIAIPKRRRPKTVLFLLNYAGSEFLCIES